RRVRLELPTAGKADLSVPATTMPPPPLQTKRGGAGPIARAGSLRVAAGWKRDLCRALGRALRDSAGAKRLSDNRHRSRQISPSVAPKAAFPTKRSLMFHHGNRVMAITAVPVLRRV